MEQGWRWGGYDVVKKEGGAWLQDALGKSEGAGGEQPSTGPQGKAEKLFP